MSIKLLSVFLFFYSIQAWSHCGPSDVYPFETCISLVPFNDIQGNKKDYTYSDPKTKKGKVKSDLIQYQKPIRFMDLNQFDPKFPVSEDFVLHDFLRSENGRYGFFQTQALEHIQEIRKQLNRPLIINSGYRSPGHNKKVAGSSSWSRHMYGDAADISAKSASQIKDLKRECERQMASIFLYSDHVHCDWRNETLDSNFYDSENQSTVQVLTQEEYRKKLEKLHEKLVKIGLDIEFGKEELREKKDEKTVFLRADSELLDHENEGELFVEWEIVNSNENSRDLFFGKELSLRLKKGSYFIKATVGGYKTVEAEIVVD